MEYIFLLAERLVANIKMELVDNKESTGYFSFDSCILRNNSFEIKFINTNQSIILLKVSTHPLDMPWNISLYLDSNRIEGNYEVYPNLLKEPDTLGNELSLKVARDIVSCLLES